MAGHKAKGKGEAEEKEIAVDHHLIEEEEYKDMELMVMKVQREEET